VREVSDAKESVAVVNRVTRIGSSLKTVVTQLGKLEEGLDFYLLPACPIEDAVNKDPTNYVRMSALEDQLVAFQVQINDILAQIARLQDRVPLITDITKAEAEVVNPARGGLRV
jgi:hypothetical protein